MAALPATYPCGFCGEAARWPSGCPGIDPDAFCLEEVDYRHSLGDHRRCSPRDCDEYALIAEVASRGSDFAKRAGLTYAVVNTLVDPWEFRAFANLQQAKPFRSRVGKAALGRDALSIEFKRAVFVVRADGSVI